MAQFPASADTGHTASEDITEVTDLLTQYIVPDHSINSLKSFRTLH